MRIMLLFLKKKLSEIFNRLIIYILAWRTNYIAKVEESIAPQPSTGWKSDEISGLLTLIH